MKWILRLYPPSWQRRYREEVAAHLDQEGPARLRTTIDLAAGAADAWLNPDSIPPTEASPPTELNRRTNPMQLACSRSDILDISKSDAIRSGGLMIGTSLVLTVIGVALAKTYGDHILIEALLHSAFFIALLVSSPYTYLRPYSRTARIALVTAGSVAWYGFFLGVALVGARV